jgi:predicted adenylyl cyclase CyaB
MQNLEIKCVCPDLKRAEKVALGELKAERFGKLAQIDTYFHIAPGRLKLRENRQLRAEGRKIQTIDFELIHYHRRNRKEAKASSYRILGVQDGKKTLHFFADSLGIKTRVHKTRKIFLKGNLRIHLDLVRGLGSFLEFELIVNETHPLEECRRTMPELLRRFHIAGRELIRFSYSDLVLQRSRV